MIFKSKDTNFQVLVIPDTLFFTFWKSDDDIEFQIEPSLEYTLNYDSEEDRDKDFERLKRELSSKEDQSGKETNKEKPVQNSYENQKLIPDYKNDLEELMKKFGINQQQ